MRARRGRLLISGALVAGVLAAGQTQSTADSTPARSSPAPMSRLGPAPDGLPATQAGPGARARAADASPPPTIPAQVNLDPRGQAMPPGFLGVSIEYPALHLYTGRDPRHIDPVLINLLRGLNPGQRPVLRIGGDSADGTWWPTAGMLPPGGVNYALSPNWLHTARALAQALDARLILGVNFAGNRPAVAGIEARALLQGIGSRYVDALEIGNEPDLYPIFAWYRTAAGRWVYPRSHSWNMRSLIGDYRRWRSAMPPAPIAGPSFAALTWMNQLGTFLRAEHGLGLVSLHRYPLKKCTTDPSSPTYATIPNLLAGSSSAGLAAPLGSYARQAHAAGVPFRVGEMNSVACRGKQGVSDTFASALWALDTLYDFAGAGVDGVNFHVLPGAYYELFSPSEANGRWSALVHPEYYGLLMFARGFPPGAHLLDVSVPDGPVRVYATRGRDGHVRVTLINKDPQNPVTVAVRIQYASGPAGLQRLEAPAIDATQGVSLGGRSFGDSTPTGRLGAPAQEIVTPGSGGAYSIRLPAASAALLTR